jgi:hypothetical protein
MPSFANAMSDTDVEQKCFAVNLGACKPPRFNNNASYLVKIAPTQVPLLFQFRCMLAVCLDYCISFVVDDGEYEYRTMQDRGLGLQSRTAETEPGVDGSAQ